MAKSRFFFNFLDTEVDPDCLLFSQIERGWSAGAMVLGKLSVPRRATNLDNTEKGKGL